MNKIVKTIVVLVAGTMLTAGTAVAAPHHGALPRGQAPASTPASNSVGTGPDEVACFQLPLAIFA